MSEDRIIEQAIEGHARTRDAIRWAIEQEREVCAKLCERLEAQFEGDELLGVYCADAIRERSQK